MIRTLATTFALLGVAALLVPAQAQEDAAKSELAKFAGTWKPSSFQMPEGKPRPPKEVLDEFRFVFKGDKLEVMRGDEKEDTITIKLDPAAKHIDMIHADKEKGTMKGIYEFKNGKLRLCLSGPPGGKERPRPTKFEVKELEDDGEQAIFEFEKAKD